MATTDTTHDSSSTAWLGELDHLRAELAPRGATDKLAEVQR